MPIAALQELTAPISATRGARLHYHIAKTPGEFEAIHRLNYQTFVEEIPQHPPDPSRRLIDRFHAENTYVIATLDDALIGMVAGRCARPFSLDAKLRDLDRHLPPHRQAVEVRLLAVAPAHRKTVVFARLVALLARHFRAQGCDLALISGTVRQRRLYAHFGFVPFAHPVGTSAALYQPMFLTLTALDHVQALRPRLLPSPLNAHFQPGPVAITSQVHAAFNTPPHSHRAPRFLEQLCTTRRLLCALTQAADVTLMVGTGTLANDAVAAQLRGLSGSVYVLSNGEFGERLIDHARRWALSMVVERHEWGAPLDWGAIERTAHRVRPAWIWAVLSETSTGILNPLDRLRDLARSVGAGVCLDAVSAVGLVPTDLRGVRFATAVSGKGLASFPGLAAIFHEGRLAPAGQLPRYLDLASYTAADGVPYTHSSNLVAALHGALASTSWPQKFARVGRASITLRAALRELGLPPLAPLEHATPGIFTVPLPPHARAEHVGTALAAEGLHIAYQSEYLRRRNWVQLCLMGAFDDAALDLLPKRLAAAVTGA
jgi:aspartate aminotransferase-like enzyme/GNAT superfamily N-acetyltransferase